MHNVTTTEPEEYGSFTSQESYLFSPQAKDFRSSTRLCALVQIFSHSVIYCVQVHNILTFHPIYNSSVSYGLSG